MVNINPKLLFQVKVQAALQPGGGRRSNFSGD
jgi:hypothetical protein